MGPGGQQRQKREQKAEAEAAVRLMQSEAAVVLIVEIPVNRGERQSTINKEEKGLQGGYQKKMSEDGGLIQDCATTGCGSDGQTGEVRF